MAALQQCINNAKFQKGKVKIRFIKLFLTGSAAAGKTSFSNLLMKSKFVDFHDSTNIVQAKHAVSVKKAIVVESTQCDDHNVVWLEMEDNFQICHLSQILLSFDISSLRETQIIKEQKMSSPSPLLQPKAKTSTSPTANTDNKAQNASIRKQYVTCQSPSMARRFIGRFHGSVKCEKLACFNSFVHNILELDSASKHEFKDNRDVFNIITVLDTGGQPEYIHLLPTVNIHPMVNFVVHDLTKNLEDQVVVEFSEHGKQIFEPYHLKYSNLDMIKFLMSSINDSLERSSSQIPQLVKIPGKKNNSSYLCCIGTHADKVDPCIIQSIDTQLTAMVDKLDCKTSVWQNENSGILFPVDNTTAGNDAKEDSRAKYIRNTIDRLATDKDIYELPITWMLFELEIRSNSEKGYISFNECYHIAKQANLMSTKEEVKSALIYHHLLGVLLYYPDVPGLCNYVIIHHQWLFDKISSIVCLALKYTCDKKATNNLKYHGILTKELIQKLNFNEELKVEYFISLLTKMKIIVPIQRKDSDSEKYFIPYILPACTMQSCCDDKLSQYGFLQGEPFLIHFASNLLPRGFFCCLVVQVLQQLPTGWNHLITEKDTHHTFSNFITLKITGAYFLSLLDKFSYLEIQIRHQKEQHYQQIPVHFEVQQIISKAMKSICEQLNYDYGRLQFGFHCKCGKTDEAHIAVITKLTPPFDYYAMCSLGGNKDTELRHEHNAWLIQVIASSRSICISSYVHYAYTQTYHLIQEAEQIDSPQCNETVRSNDCGRL